MIHILNAFLAIHEYEISYSNIGAQLKTRKIALLNNQVRIVTLLDESHFQLAVAQHVLVDLVYLF